jgi:peptidoglycan-associated lipoprotein
MIESINSEGDDFGIMFLPKDEKKGYFSSNRKGGSGGDDIYSFELKD